LYDLARRNGDAMDTPEIVTVKISSEAAEYLSLSQVVVRQMPLAELVEAILGVTGKSLARVCEVLRRGVLVAGASRFRWQGWDPDAESIRRQLDAFPDSDPTRTFRPDQCVRVALCGARCRIEITRETGAARAWLRRRSFWDALMNVAAAARPRYLEYSYKDKADWFRFDLSEEMAAGLRDAASLLRYSALRSRIGASVVEWIELLAER
jgi:hypothetical protein